MASIVTKHANTGVPIVHLQRFLWDCAKTANAPYLISIGSGTGCYEYEMTHGRPDLRARLILVDPDPESFRQEPTSERELRPHFATTQDLLKARPEVVEACILLLIWPSPAPLVPYDLEAVEQLRPKGILILYETAREVDPSKEGGSSGSERLHKELLANPLNTDYRCIAEARYKCLMPHAEYQVCRALDPDFSPKLDVRLAWLAKRGASIPKDRSLTTELAAGMAVHKGLW
jgi:hypothetical protein